MRPWAFNEELSGRSARETQRLKEEWTRCEESEFIPSKCRNRWLLSDVKLTMTLHGKLLSSFKPVHSQLCPPSQTRFYPGSFPDALTGF